MASILRPGLHFNVAEEDYHGLSPLYWLEVTLPELPPPADRKEPSRD